MTTATATIARGTLLERVNAIVRRIIGAPDYSAYLRHQSARHPNCTPLTEKEFLDEQLTARYSTPGSRCC
jgi:uncharacterized short protein YbdD (DUF466 family)